MLNEITISSLLRKKLQPEKVEKIVHEAVEIETEFVCEAIPCALISMNVVLMRQYIKFVADRLLVQLMSYKFVLWENPNVEIPFTPSSHEYNNY